jgi:phage terminase small subunit
LPNVAAVYTEADYKLLETYCLWHAIQVVALKAMDVDTANKAAQRCTNLASKLCLTPTDRNRMPVIPEKELDELEQLARLKVV